MKYKIITLGCKVNKYESEAIATMLDSNGFSSAAANEECDVFILNSCTVTSTGDQKVRQTLRREKKNNPSAVVVLTGCMAQAFPKKSEELKEADIVLGTQGRSRLVGHIMSNISNKQRIIDIESHKSDEKFEKMEVNNFSDRSRAYIKIQDGCNRFCSYCIIPYARGRVRSKPIEDIAVEINKISENGYKEVVLVGINLSCYGQDFGLTLCDAIECAAKVNGIERVRLGSLEPELLQLDVIKRMAKIDKLCNHFHLSLQSGCDETLERMNRHYSTAEYLEIVNNLRDNFKNCAITTDIMVGFPMESEDEFNKSLDFVKKVNFSQAHIFPYSIREGTKAANMRGQISNSIKHKRSKEMHEVCAKTQNEFYKSHVGKEVKILFERESDKNVYEGHTTNYIPVKVSSAEDIRANVFEVVIDLAGVDCCYGKIIDKNKGKRGK